MIVQLIRCHKEVKEFCYQHRLVACAMKFTSGMLEDDIIQYICKQLPVVGSTTFSQTFSFLKAVDDLLIERDTESQRYSTVKYIAGQGQIYIRIHKKLKAEGDLLEDDYDYEDNEIHIPSVAT